jgi:hypothetical protein
MGIIKNLFYKNYEVNEIKFGEIQIYYQFYFAFMLNFNIELNNDKPLFNLNFFNILSIDLCKTINCDHAGIFLEINILGLNILWSEYDTRHYDHDKEEFINE